MGALVRLLALLSMLPTLPGISEAMEDAAHWLREGHTVHDQGHTEGAPGGEAEHGCSGLQHLCRCCPAGHVLLAAPSVASLALVSTAARPAWSSAAGLGAENQAPPLRPPIA